MTARSDEADIARDLRRILAKHFDVDEREQITKAIVDRVQEMRQYGQSRADPPREIFARLGDRWSVLLLLLLELGSFRNGTLRRLIGKVSAEGGISQRMLTLRLRALERDGFVVRAVKYEAIQSVKYSITPLGREFLSHIHQLLEWVKFRSTDIRASRAEFDKREPDLWRTFAEQD